MPEYLVGSNAITRVLVRGRQECQSGYGCDNGSKDGREREIQTICAVRSYYVCGNLLQLQ